MLVTFPSCAKINLGLRIGPLREDGFHELRTVYQTIALHDIVSVSVERGSGIEIRCDDPRVPTDSTNTCWRIIENAVTTLLALEQALRKKLPAVERLRITSEVGSDIPLFLIGGTVLGVGRGEEVYPLPDLPAMTCVISLPEVAISTPKAFADWDLACGAGAPAREVAEHSSARTGEGARPHMAGSPHMAAGNPSSMAGAKLTASTHSDRMLKFSREISAWLNAAPSTGGRRSGVSARGGGRAENPLLDLVRTGIENDFERVVFPKYPELLEVKRVLERTGARYASLSGSGSAIYGLFDSQQTAAAAAKKLIRQGTRAIVTSTLTRRQYWKRLRISD
jgi:4-diphosphocytidyl-2-C-methyl-D-erythritol kinase